MKISTLCKYIDQPMILNKLDQKNAGTSYRNRRCYGIIDSLNHTKKEQKYGRKKFIQNAIVISSTITASLIGTRGLKNQREKNF